MPNNSQHLKDGIHSVFRQTIKDLRGVGIMAKPLYEIAEIRQMRSAYAELIASSPREEDVQAFIHSNPLIWHFLAPTRILSKPPLLTKHNADFGILTVHKILYFVEIEKPQSRVVGAKGKLHGDVQRAFEQIRDWSIVIEDHRLAVLDSLGIQPEEVHDIRYIVVAGLAAKASSAGLNKLQRNLPTENTQFYCFDHIESFLRALEEHLVKS